MNVQEVQKLNNINTSETDQTAKLRYGLESYAAPRVQNDLFKLSGANNQFKRNPIEAVYEKFLSKYNPSALLERYLSVDFVEAMLQNAPEVNELLNSKGVTPVVCMENMEKIKDSHVKTTVDIALFIANELNLSKEDRQNIALGSLFHDFGKIMIPAELLNKQGKLTPEERSIVDTHSQIGYELLKTTGMNQAALSIVRNHHRSASMTNDILAKIVSVADVYSALTEKRAYKEEMTAKDALEIIYSFVKEGKLDGAIVSALENCLNKSVEEAA